VAYFNVFVMQCVIQEPILTFVWCGFSYCLVSGVEVVGEGVSEWEMECLKSVFCVYTLKMLFKQPTKQGVGFWGGMLASSLFLEVKFILYLEAVVKTQVEEL
jgi:hypothetical protein